MARKCKNSRDLMLLLGLLVLSFTAHSQMTQTINDWNTRQINRPSDSYPFYYWTNHGYAYMIPQANDTQFNTWWTQANAGALPNMGACYYGQYGWGGWGGWYAITGCTASCGGGTYWVQRDRGCTGPGGRVQCCGAGSTYEQQNWACNTHPCCGGWYAETAGGGASPNGCAPTICHRLPGNGGNVTVTAICSSGGTCLRWHGVNPKPGWVQDSTGYRCQNGVTW